MCYGDTLSPEGEALPKATLMLTNPPFGSKKGGGLPSRTDLEFPTSNKQVCFLQHIYRGLKPGGRAAAVFPDNVLFESNVGRQDPGWLNEQSRFASLTQRTDTGKKGRFRRFSREWIAERGDNLDIAWLKDEHEADQDELPAPAILTQEAMGKLEAAMAESRGILQELGEEIITPITIHTKTEAWRGSRQGNWPIKESRAL
jgi:N-6 DNA Methylase